MSKEPKMTEEAMESEEQQENEVVELRARLVWKEGRHGKPRTISYHCSELAARAAIPSTVRAMERQRRREGKRRNVVGVFSVERLVKIVKREVHEQGGGI